MKNSGMKFLPIGLFCLLLGCSQYQSKALTEQAVQQQLETPTAQQLSIQAAQLKYPLLKPVAFNIQDGLSPDEAAILAVLRNPELRAVRDQHGIAMATVAATFALLPLAMGIGAGSEMLQQLAIAIMSGLVVQIPLVLMVSPGFLLLFKPIKQ